MSFRKSFNRRIQRQKIGFRRYKKKPTICKETGKIRFKDHHDAMLALEDARAKAAWAETHDLPTSRHETRAYKCDLCRGWHLTSRPQRQNNGHRLYSPAEAYIPPENNQTPEDTSAEQQPSAE